MPKQLYISDLHFGHGNIIRFDNRPFHSIEEMESALVANWNSAVSPEDTVHILGDFSWGKDDDWRRVLSMLTGGKVLVRGNHDLKHFSAPLKAMFQDIKDYKEVKDGGRRVILSHYPSLFYRAAYNPQVYMLCGHVHTTRENDFLNRWRQELRASHSHRGDNYAQIYNVGCMLPYMGYTPRTLDEIIEGAES